MKAADEQSEGVALVVVSVPESHVLATADPDKHANRAEVDGAAVGNGQELGPGIDGASS